MRQKPETKLVQYIIDSVHHYKGFAEKWAMPMMRGVPDLLIGIPKKGLFIAEVKFTPIIYPTRVTNIKLTATQQFKLNHYNSVLPNNVKVLLGTYDQGATVLYSLPITPMTTSYNYRYIINLPRTFLTDDGIFKDIFNLF
jgi:hypothetical protein